LLLFCVLFYNRHQGLVIKTSQTILPYYCFQNLPFFPHNDQFTHILQCHDLSLAFIFCYNFMNLVCC
jgi:hypothetical protein